MLDSFSGQLREATWTDHRDAEKSPFMHALLSGGLPRQSYVELIAQLAFVYQALEEGAAQLRTDPTYAPILAIELDRMAALQADLLYLRGTSSLVSSSRPLGATERYVMRIRDATNGPPASFIAHHYTRYLGDLSGGRAIGRTASRAYGLSPECGASFYQFEAIQDPASFKAAYRSMLDAAPWSDTDRASFIAEVAIAYRLNSDLFDELQSLA